MRPGWRDILIKMRAQSPLLKLRSPRMTIKNEFCLKYFEAPESQNLSKFDSNTAIILHQ